MPEQDKDRDKKVQEAEAAAQRQREAQQADERERQQHQADEDRARESQGRVRSGTGDETPTPGSAEERSQRKVGAVPGGAHETEQAIQQAAADPLRLGARSAGEPAPVTVIGDTADGNDPQIALKRATEAPRTVLAPESQEEVQAEPKSGAQQARDEQAQQDRTRQATAQQRDAQREDTERTKP